MLNIAIMVVDRCHGSGVNTVLDTLTTANYLNQQYLNNSHQFCQFEMLGKQQYATAYNGQRIGPLKRLTDAERPDILILPGIVEAVLSTSHIQSILEKYKNWYPKLREWHAAGTVIAACCSSNLLVAAIGLAKGRPLTCHWATEPAVKALFPNENFQTRKMIFDHGDIVSMGGATSIGQMMLHLIERFGNRELSMLTAKMLLIDPERGEQAPFALFSPNKKHQDDLVLEVQAWLEEHYQDKLNVTDMGDTWNISERQLSRRFKKATGETTGNYLQALRLEHVKRGLESSGSAFNNIIWDAGYEDVSSFRRLFKRETSMTMKEYRQRFGRAA